MVTVKDNGLETKQVKNYGVLSSDMFDTQESYYLPEHAVLRKQQLMVLWARTLPWLWKWIMKGWFSSDKNEWEKSKLYVLTCYLAVKKHVFLNQCRSFQKDSSFLRASPHIVLRLCRGGCEGDGSGSGLLIQKIMYRQNNHLQTCKLITL